MTKKDVDYYMCLPYTIQIRPVDDGDGVYYFAKVLELDGCISHGDTWDEAYKNVREAMKGYIEVKLERGFPIPEPPKGDFHERH